MKQHLSLQPSRSICGYSTRAEWLIILAVVAVGLGGVAGYQAYSHQQAQKKTETERVRRMSPAPDPVMMARMSGQQVGAKYAQEHRQPPSVEELNQIVETSIRDLYFDGRAPGSRSEYALRFRMGFEEGFKNATTPAFTTGPEKGNSDAPVVGEWELSGGLSAPEVRASAQSLPADVNVAWTITGTANYQSEGSFFKCRRCSMDVSGPKGAVTMNFDLKESGDWNIQSGVLTEKTLDAALTPVDELTRSMLNEAPNFVASLRLVKGQLTTYQLLSSSTSELRLRDNALNGMILTFKRQKSQR